jgi:hypothetical protein
MADARTKWKRRVAEWRASGETADEFASGRGFAANSLRWWSSKLGRDAAPAPVVRVAHLVRSPADAARTTRGAIVIEAIDARVRITIEPGADREVLATVLALIGRTST